MKYYVVTFIYNYKFSFNNIFMFTIFALISYLFFLSKSSNNKSNTQTQILVVFYLSLAIATIYFLMHATSPLNISL